MATPAVIERVGRKFFTEAPDDQYVLVAAGTRLHDGMTLPSLSCLYVSREAQPLALQAAAAGLEGLILQFPVTAALLPKAPSSDHGRHRECRRSIVHGQSGPCGVRAARCRHDRLA